MEIWNVDTLVWYLCSLWVCVHLQGDFRHKSSFVIWGGRGRCGPPRRVEEVTCGTTLRAVWPRSRHTSRSELSAWLPFKHSSLPKVTGFHRKCSGIIHVGHPIWSPIPEFFSSSKQVLFTVFAWFELRWRIMNHYCASRKGGVTSLQTWPSSHRTVTMYI